MRKKSLKGRGPQYIQKEVKRNLLVAKAVGKNL